MEETNLVQKSSSKYCCEKCNFMSCRKSQYDRHLTTDKHKRKQMEIKKFQKVPDEVSCKCGRLFKTNSGLWKHKKKCNFIVEAQSIDTSSNKIDIPQEFQENQDYKEMFFKIMAENFLKQIEVSLQQLDVTKTKGITEGLSNVFIENMNKLSIYERPLHCTDAKRETLYIKENDVWEKDIDKSRIRAAIKDASITQYKTMQKWIDANPDYMEDQDKQKYFIDMVRHCGKDLNDIDDKIIRKICTTSYVKDILNEIN